MVNAQREQDISGGDASYQGSRSTGNFVEDSCRHAIPSRVRSEITKICGEALGPDSLLHFWKPSAIRVTTTWYSFYDKILIVLSASPLSVRSRVYRRVLPVWKKPKSPR